MFVRCPDCGTVTHQGYNTESCECGFAPNPRFVDFKGGKILVGMWVDPMKFYEDFHFPHERKINLDFKKEGGEENV